MALFTPRKCGVKFDPPALILYYLVNATEKVHRRSMPLRNFTANTSIDETVMGLKSGKHERYLEKVSAEQLRRLLSMIQDKIKKETKTQGDSEGKDPEDLNKLSDNELDKKKAEMDTVFQVNRLKPEDAGFKYEVEVEFDGKNSSGWDSAEEYSDPEF